MAAEIGTLSDTERQALIDGWYTREHGEKAIRIIDAQATTLDRVRKLVNEPWPVGSPEARLASDVREALGG